MLLKENLYRISVQNIESRMKGHGNMMKMIGLFFIMIVVAWCSFSIGFCIGLDEGEKRNHVPKSGTKEE